MELRALLLRGLAQQQRELAAVAGQPVGQVQGAGQRERGGQPRLDAAGRVGVHLVDGAARVAQGLERGRQRLGIVGCAQQEQGACAVLEVQIE